ncbi:MAG: Jag N-terminal domain-containing protein [Sulfurospirillum sp.]|nr:Jag N-terminal domain-containing protein [Sulfurospirillum sp.]MBL0703492.1 Jag N-terminal domain-containing protein [Sulfurospirillum sp.]
MIRIEADTLEEAYSKAASELTCSVTQITFNVIQNPKSGFLGMFKKSAIIEARHKNESNLKSQYDSKSRSKKKKIKINKKSNQLVNEEKKFQKPVSKKIIKKENTKQTIAMQTALIEIQNDINTLFIHSCFELDKIKVKEYREDTVLIEFDGKDAALLIGKEGYRYKSLSYLLYHWINMKYNLNVRLEVAEFLQNQEEMIERYLVGIIERINSIGRAKTKILDGVLVKIALEALRKEFPNKYVGIKSSREGGRFIVVNDFNKKK